MQAIHIVRTFTLEVPDGTRDQEIATPVTDAEGTTHMVPKVIQVPVMKEVKRVVDLVIGGPGMVVHHILQDQCPLKEYPKGSRIVHTQDETRYLDDVSPPE